MKHRVSAEFSFTVELIVVIAVIATVVALLLSAFSQSRKRMEVIAATDEVLECNRPYLSVFYAMKGEWPRDNEELQTMFPGWSSKQNSGLVKEYAIRNGAVDVILSRPFSGKTITLHPAVPADDPLGPVKWVVGAQARSNGWAAAGEDRTTVDRELIPTILKQ